ncbi:MAG: isocitrate lyase/phosphoenolpyruvate mutase family protein [Rubellimicrobium sp.]|nr:isocitrate lyase/phosphoenolpyruvate mutase family protein [Rubellimicrobium sp.]
MTGQAELAQKFRARHQPGNPLFMPNVWDALSARITAEAGFEALATTSGGVAWALGHADEEHTPWDEEIAALRRITRAARGLPVTADIEGGFGATPDDVGDHIVQVARAGVVGVNLEDSTGGALRPVDEAAARIAGARAGAARAGVPVVINARCDVFMLGGDTPDALLDAALARGRAYLRAGADCIFPFGLLDPARIARFCRDLGAPVNVSARPGLPGVAELARLGVARITTGTATTLVAAAATRHLMQALRAGAPFDVLSAAMTYPDAQALFRTEGHQP